METNSTAIAHLTESERLILTDSTVNLQKFLLNHAGTNELFKEYGVMVRRQKQ